MSDHDISESSNEQTAAKPAGFWSSLQFWIVLLIGLCAGAAIYVLLHLAGKLGSMGQEGSNAAQIWSLIIAIVELGASITAIVITIWAQKNTSKKRAAVSKKRLAAQRPQYIAAGIIAAVIAFIVPPAFNKWSFTHVSTEDVTQTVQLKNNKALIDGDSAEITLPPTKHKKAKLTLRLTSQQTTGSCVGPARMKLTPVYGGNRATSITEVLSGSEQTLTLGDMRQPAHIKVDLKNDPYCTVGLVVSSAVYFE